MNFIKNNSKAMIHVAKIRKRINYNVGYPRSGFEYFLNGFVYQADQVRSTTDQDRTRRALSIARVIFPN
jgi:hypothetical protein